jgi:hypothetical protein
MNVDRYPDFKGCLRPYAMILESGEQTNYPMLYPLTGNGETVIFAEFGIDVSVHPSTRFEQYAAIYQAAQIFWMNATRDSAEPTLRERIASPNRTLRFGKIENSLLYWRCCINAPI